MPLGHKAEKIRWIWSNKICYLTTSVADLTGEIKVSNFDGAALEIYYASPALLTTERFEL